MSTDTTPFRSDCEHVLQRLPVIDMTMRFTCTQCGGIRDLADDYGSYEALTAKMLTELGGTIVNESTEPRRWEYPAGGVLNEVYANHEAIALLHLNTADIAFIEYLDAWIDKGIAEGTLEIGKAARYRKAIARRCVELGEVPHRRESIRVLDLKAGDILALIAPANSQAQMAQMYTDIRQLLDHVGADGVEVVVFPRGTEIRVLDRQPAPEEPKVHIQTHDRPAGNSGVSSARFRQMLEEEVRRNAAIGRSYP